MYKTRTSAAGKDVDDGGDLADTDDEVASDKKDNAPAVGTAASDAGKSKYRLRPHPCYRATNHSFLDDARLPGFLCGYRRKKSREQKQHY